MTVEQIYEQMRAYIATWRAQGITQVPIAWLEYWANLLAQARLHRPYQPFLYDPFWMPGLPVRPAGRINVEITRTFPFFR